MPVGLQVLKDNGVIQIDERWVNFELVKKELIVSGAVSMGGSTIVGASVLSAMEDLVFVSCSSGFGLAGVGVENSQKRTYIAAENSGVELTFYHFRRQAPTASTAGLQVFTADDQLAFDANSKYCRVAGDILVDMSSPQFSKILPSGRIYAVLIPEFVGRVSQSYRPLGTNTGIIETNFYTRSINCGSDRVNVGAEFRYRQTLLPWSGVGTPNLVFYSFSGGRSLISDVTGY